MENNFSFLSIFSLSDPVVFATSLLLVAASVYSWAIIIGKFRLWNAETVRPMKIPADANPDTIADKMIIPYDKNLWFLSMTSAVAPFVGLFGTIWGIMHVFSAIGANSSASLVVIAPGLAVALGTTALGLVAAIPAAIFYQMFTKKSDELYNKLEATAKEMKGKKIMARRRNSVDANALIVMTPMIDVMTVLLAVFLVAAPMLTAGIDMDLPRAGKSAMSGDDHALQITIDSRGNYFIGNNLLTRDDIVKKANAMRDENPKLSVVLNGDKSADYGAVMNVMGALKDAGFQKVGLRTKLDN